VRVYIGIDPGASGGIAAINEQGEIVACEKWINEIQANYHLASLEQSFSQLHCVIEQVSAMPGNGVAGMFRFGENFGMWQGLLVAHRIPFRKVRPQVWQKEIHGRKGLKGTPLKQLLKAEAQRRFPSLKITNATADAILIADYCRRNH
jgi:hypothetical protein